MSTTVTATVTRATRTKRFSLLPPHSLPRQSCTRQFQYRQQQHQCKRGVATLASNPHIYIHPHPDPNSNSNSTTQSAGPVQILSYLPTLTTSTLSLSIASTTTNLPTPASTRENPEFLNLLQSVVAEHATHDPAVQAQARQFASTGGAGGAFFIRQPSSSSSSSLSRRSTRGAGAMLSARKKPGDGAGGASGQGGIGGAGVGGWIHVSDERNPPDWGRVAYTEDILGSLQVDGEGKFAGPDGNFQWSGAYRIITNEGILGLSPYLRERLVEKLKQLEAAILSRSLRPYLRERLVEKLKQLEAAILSRSK